jgi:hypothetical protein
MKNVSTLYNLCVSAQSVKPNPCNPCNLFLNP